MLSISIYTLGCKVNQLESESIAAAFKDEGFRVLPWENEGDLAADSLEPHRILDSPGILVVNTCTVTSKAEQKARRIIRRALRSHPRSVLIVTGCYAQLNPQDIDALERDPAAQPRDGELPEPGVSSTKNRLFLIKGDQKSALLDLPKFLVTESRAILGDAWDKPDPGVPLPPQSVIPLVPVLLSRWIQSMVEAPVQNYGRFRFNPGHFSFHSRASLKIQDGCDHSCSYCRVSFARGTSISLGAERALAALKVLEEKGYGEAVLTGVNICQYQDGSRDLGGLLDYLLAGTSSIRLRLSSLEPDGITQGLIAVLSNPRIRPHFHLSVQSGSPLILERMGRPYPPEAVERGVHLLRSIKDDPFLACDIITGFPGETPEAFEATYQLCQELDFTWIHAFPYSRRPGTKAYTFKDPVSEREAQCRMDRLLALGAQGRQGYIHRWIGKTLEAVIENPRELGPSWAAGVTDNYLKLLLPISQPPPPTPGSLLRCRIRGIPDKKGPFSAFDVIATGVPE